MTTDCHLVQLAALLLALALLASFCLNLIFCCIRHRQTSCKDKKPFRRRKCPPPIEEDFPGDTNNCESRQENSVSLHLLQENPIYGNIVTDSARKSSVVYEAMAVRARDRSELVESDLNYASLDLKLAMRRKRKHQQGQVPGRISPPDQPQAQFTPTEGNFLDEVSLPLRDQDLTVPHCSIYLNSHQMSQEIEDIGNMNWKTPEEERTEEWSQQQNEGHVCGEDGN